MSGRKPFLLKPAFKDYLWGGQKLRDEYGKETDLQPLAESWECSTHPDGESRVVSGEFIGMTLSEVLKNHPEFLGTHPRTKGELPILVKLIDARQDLSVQVHPTDEYAMEHENGQLGKTEMWYVLHAEPGAKLIYGFRKDMTPQQIRHAVEKGTLSRSLQEVPVKKNDVFLINAGTVHAIGAGIVVAEIQESSNLTYRIYDYDRVDKNGKKRELHIEKALEVTNGRSSARPRQPMRVLNYRNGYAKELLARCKYFQVERMLLNTERCRNMAEFASGPNSFRVLLCTGGCGTMYGEGVSLCFFKGDCLFIPAESIPLKLHGRAQLLDIGC